MRFFWRKNGPDSYESNGDAHRNNKLHIDFPITIPFWVLGVLLALYLLLQWLKANPEALTAYKTSMFSKNTVSSTTTGEFQLASDLYTARSHVCDVLLYQDGNREMTMILRYHVNVLYNMNQVSIYIIESYVESCVIVENETHFLTEFDITEDKDASDRVHLQIEEKIKDELIRGAVEKTQNILKAFLLSSGFTEDNIRFE